jgi:cytochrome c5
MSKRFLFVSVVALVLFAPIGASAQAGARAGAKAAPAKPGTVDMAKAKQIYTIDCALCHGATGDGKTDIAKDMQLTLSDWTDPKSLAGMSDQELFKIIRNGKDKMPPEDAGRAKDDEVQALVVYIRTFSKNGPAPAAAPAPSNWLRGSSYSWFTVLSASRCSTWNTRGAFLFVQSGNPPSQYALHEEIMRKSRRFAPRGTKKRFVVHSCQRL